MAPDPALGRGHRPGSQVLTQGQAFWDWALIAYARAGVAPVCLTLQDEHEQSVPFLLWAAWAAQQARWPDDDLLSRAAVLAQAWDAAAVQPLRQARRAAKAPLDDLDDDARETVRAQIKAVELAAERALMQALERLTPAAGEALTPAQALDKAVAAWGQSAPGAALQALAAKLD